MKIKIDFVTNSSSSNFRILKSQLTEFQIQCIYDHLLVGRSLDKNSISYTGNYDKWQIMENKKYIVGSTSMTNFDLYWLMDQLNISSDIIEIDKYSPLEDIKIPLSKLDCILDGELSPCKKCPVDAVCKKSIFDGSSCDKAYKYIRKLVKEETNC